MVRSHHRDRSGSNQHPAHVELQDCTLAAWYRSLYAPRTGGAHDSHHRTAGIAGRTRRGSGRVAARGAGAAGRAHAAHWRAPELGRGRSGSEVRLMTIRLKILSLAFLILIIFGVVLGISTSLQHDFIIQIDALTRYHVPLRTLIARFDVLTYEYELIMMRLLRRSDITQRDIESARAQARQYADQIVDDLRQIN